MATSTPEKPKKVVTDGHHSALDSDYESENNDDVMSRTSAEARRHDHETITAEEEAERLLNGDDEKSQTKLFRRDGRESKRASSRRQRRRDRWSRGENGESELMYKVEEGERSSSAESHANSSEEDMRRIGQAHAKRKSKASRCGRFAALHIVIIVAFLALLFGAYKASSGPSKDSTGSKSNDIAKTLSNGTHDFAPTTILISLDGFRADFLQRGLTPTLASFINQGVSPKYMHPSFPSLTFPNHFTLVTGMVCIAYFLIVRHFASWMGLSRGTQCYPSRAANYGFHSLIYDQYPESHGIVGNTFWDPAMLKGFTYSDPDLSMKPEYWNAEPIWETAELQGMRTAIHMWPGSEAHIGTLEPTYVDKYNGDEKLESKVKRILGWLDTPGPNDIGASESAPRPQLIASYVPNVDTDGHRYGPNSTYIRSTIAEVDGMLGSLFKGIEARNLTNVVNVVVVSDHGMATTSNHRLVQLEDLLDPDLIEHIDGWPLYGLRPKDKSQGQLKKLHEQLLAKSQLPQYKGNFDVYLRDQDLPERYHFSKNDRIAPLWIVPQPGWAIVTKEEFNIEVALDRDEVYNPRGLHGYDNEHPLMRAIFVARGPAFPHPEGSQVAPFQNTEVYNIVCDSLGLEPKPNNGTLRLPLETIGLHDSEAQDEIPDDPPAIDTGAQLIPPELPGVENLPPPPVQEAEPLDEPNEAESTDESFNPKPSTDRPVVEDGGSQEDQDQSWLDWINAKLDNVKVWASGLFGGDKDHPQSAEETRHGDNW